MTEEDKLILAAWVMRSTYRVKIMKVLKKHSIIPSIISRETQIDKHHVSNVLRDLKERSLVKCLNESESKGRIYTLTDIGNEIFNVIEGMLLI